MANKVYTEKDFRSNLSVNPAWQMRAVVVLWEHQTAAEQAGHHTNEVNHVGFSQYDAEALSLCAKAVLAQQEPAYWMRDAMSTRLPKYAGQLWKHYLKGLSEADRYDAVQADKAEKAAAAMARRRARNDKLLSNWATA